MDNAASPAWVVPQPGLIRTIGIRNLIIDDVSFLCSGSIDPLIVLVLLGRPGARAAGVTGKSGNADSTGEIGNPPDERPARPQTA